MRPVAAFAAALVLHAALITWWTSRPHPRPGGGTPALVQIHAAPAEVEVTLVALDPVDAVPRIESTVASQRTAGTSTPRVAAATVAGTRGASSRSAGNDEASEPTARTSGPGGRTLHMRGIDLGLTDAAVERAIREAERAGPIASAQASGELQPSGHGTYKSTLGEEGMMRTATAHVARDGTVRFENAPDFAAKVVPFGIVGRAGIDDWMMRRQGIDPYASAKRQWLDRTRDERAEIGAAARTEDLARSAIAMQRNLTELWARVRDPAERKRALFELWDDVAESGDEELVRAGQLARRYLVGFARAHLPASKPGAYTAAELAELNAHRQSTAVFAPYDDRGI